jgi:hypothetical protein
MIDIHHPNQFAWQGFYNQIVSLPIVENHENIGRLQIYAAKNKSK